MALYSWENTAVPKGMLITQVYGLCFDVHGRLLLKLDGKSYGLPGGRPEAYDSDLMATLVRECEEEVNIRITRPRYLGYQCVRGDGDRDAYAQIRFIALISEIHPAKRDPDTGKQYQRSLVSPLTASSLLNWGDVGVNQVSNGHELAIQLYGIPRNPGTSEEFV